jgi:hypothetical protein
VVATGFQFLELGASNSPATFSYEHFSDSDWPTTLPRSLWVHIRQSFFMFRSLAQASRKKKRYRRKTKQGKAVSVRKRLIWAAGADLGTNQ